MSATRTPPAAPAVAGPVRGQVPRRVRSPRWLDLRLVLGVLLVLGSVLLGARVVTAADATVPVWAVAADLAAGTVLAAEDLVAVDVRLDDAAGAYLATSTRPEGRTLARAVRSGELLPRSALEEPGELVRLALPVQAGFVPPGLQRGQLVDVYAMGEGATAGPAVPGVSLALRAAPVHGVSGTSDGVLATATATVQVVVWVAAEDAGPVLEATAGRPLALVVHESVDAEGGGGPAAGTVPDPVGVPPAADTVAPAAGSTAPSPDPTGDVPRPGEQPSHGAPSAAPARPAA